MKSIIEQINKLSEKRSMEAALEAEKIIIKELEKDPYNIDLLLRFAILEKDVPLGDYEKGFIILNSALAYKPKNPLVLVILAAFHNFYGHGITKGLHDEIISYQTDDPEIKSMLYYELSWYYAEIGDKNKLEDVLQKSVNLYPKHVFNQYDLAELYYKKNKLREAKTLIQNAIANVIKIYTNDEDFIGYDNTSATQYINEIIRGTHITDGTYARLKELLRKIEEKLKEYN